MEPTRDMSTASTRIATLLAQADAALTGAGVGTPRLDAEVLLAAACGLDRTALHASSSQGVSDTCAGAFRDLLARRVRREPLQYILGRQEFWSLDFLVTPDVLVPRPETELLVELAVRIAEHGGGDGCPRVCDIGTGSGCVAVALACELPGADVWALDISAAALAVAATNAQRHGVAERIRYMRSDLFAAIPGRCFDVIVSNPPYLNADEAANLQPEVGFEPRTALDGGSGGLDVMGRLLRQAPDHLVDGGWLLVEIGATQAPAAEGLARAAGLNAIAIRSDYAGLPRVLLARR